MRLKRGEVQSGSEVQTGFLFQIGAIKTVLQSMCQYKAPEFLFQIGAIKTQVSW